MRRITGGLRDRKHAHFVELYHSGRWKHYYTEERFLHRMRDAIRAADTWAVLAPRPEPEASAGQADPAARQSPRTAA
jgi:uncharacterized repeat protein (TIGR03809 family)